MKNFLNSEAINHCGFRCKISPKDPRQWKLNSVHSVQKRKHILTTYNTLDGALGMGSEQLRATRPGPSQRTVQWTCTGTTFQAKIINNKLSVKKLSYSNHPNTGHFGVGYSNSKVRWLAQLFEYWTHSTINRLFKSSFQTTIHLLDSTIRHKSTICLVLFRWLL